MANSVISNNVQGLATATSPGLVGTGTQTFAGKKTLDGGALIKGDTSGVAIAAGYVGEMFGTLRSGTGGYTYSIRSTTVPTTGGVVVLTYTLNKGVYLVSYRSRCYVTTGTFDYKTQPRIGSVALTNQPVATTVTSTTYGSTTEVIPIVISSDSTVFDIVGTLGGGAPALGADHELWIVRLD